MRFQMPLGSALMRSLSAQALEVGTKPRSRDLNTGSELANDETIREHRQGGVRQDQKALVN